MDAESSAGRAGEKRAEPPANTQVTPPETASDAAVTEDAVERRLAEALERVAHGATVSVPAILLQRGLDVAFAAVLSNGLGATAYGLFALARRLQAFLLSLSRGFAGGLSRFLPTASPEERDAIVTVAGGLTLAASVLFGAALCLGAPWVTEVAGEGPGFRTLLQVFGLGLPVLATSYSVVIGTLRGLEEITAKTLLAQVAVPGAWLAVGLTGVVVFERALPVAVGGIAAVGAVSAVGAVWLVRQYDLRPRVRGEAVREIFRRYWEYVFPVALGAVATTIQRLGFYPLLAVYLSGVASGVFTVGVLVGGLVRLPLMGINQFMSPVAAALHDRGHDRALSRLYQVTSRLVLVGVTGLAVPVVVYRRAVMAAFGETFVPYAPLLVGFVVAQYAACAAGSVGILLKMTDHQRASLVVNSLITAGLVVTAVPLTAAFGLEGLVVSYLLMLTVNNGLEVAVLHWLEGLQPFTRRHLYPVVAAVPLAAVAVAVRATGVPLAPLVGSVVGLAVYALTLRRFGFTDVERRLAGTLVGRYRETLTGGG